MHFFKIKYLNLSRVDSAQSFSIPSKNINAFIPLYNRVHIMNPDKIKTIFYINEIISQKIITCIYIHSRTHLPMPS